MNNIDKTNISPTQDFAGFAGAEPDRSETTIKVDPDFLHHFLLRLTNACEMGDINQDCDQLAWRDIYIDAKLMLSMISQPNKAHER